MQIKKKNFRKQTHPSRTLIAGSRRRRSKKRERVDREKKAGRKASDRHE